MVSHKIDLEVMLNPNDSKLKKSLEGLSGSIFGGKGGAGGKSGSGGIFSKIFESTTMALGVLTGILGILKKVPSILQASLKVMNIGFLLILKPLADLIGLALLPIGLVMVKLAGFLMKHSSAAGIGGFVGLILGGILAVIVGISVGATPIVIGLLALFASIALAVIGSIAGAVADYIWGGIVDIEKGMISSILTAIENWIGLPEDGFFGRIINATKAWINDPTDKQSFYNMLINEFTGINIGAMVGDALKFVFANATLPGMFLQAVGKTGEALDGMAEGGIVTSPQVKLIGEAGPEAVIPLDQMGNMGGGTTINVNGIFEESRLRDIMRQVADDVFQQHRQVSGSVF